MTLRQLQFHAEAWIARLALGLLSRLGPVNASNFGGWLARTIGPLLPVTRVADENLRRALPDLTPAARRAIIIKVWDNLGRTAAELPHVASLVQTSEGPGWEAIGEPLMRQLASSPGPVILFSAHIGNWEMLPVMAAHYGIRLSSFYRAATNPIVDTIITDLRARAVGQGVPNFAKGSAGARAALAHLSKGGFLGMLVDQKMNDGIPAPFFGRTAMTAPAAAAFALRYQAPLVPAHIERLGPARFRVVIEQPLPLPNTGNRQIDIATLTTTMNATLETWIRARPGEWLWLHRRWPKE